MNFPKGWGNFSIASEYEMLPLMSSTQTEKEKESKSEWEREIKKESDSLKREKNKDCSSLYLLPSIFAKEL